MIVAGWLALAASTVLFGWRLARLLRANRGARVPVLRRPQHIPPYDTPLAFGSVALLVAGVQLVCAPRVPDHVSIWPVTGGVLVVALALVVAVRRHNRRVARP